jgi:hypothetical protein
MSTSPDPRAYPPGSEAKILALRERAAARLPLFQDGPPEPPARGPRPSAADHRLYGRLRARRWRPPQPLSRSPAAEYRRALKRRKRRHEPD